MSSMVAVEFKNVSYCYSNKPVLSDITFSVPQGCHLSIIGPNGAGKSSLLKLISRINKNYQGDIQLFGQHLTTLTSKESARLVSYVPQATDPGIMHTTYEFVLMSRYPHLSAFSGIKQIDRDIVMAALTQTQSEHLADRTLNTLSGGQRQKVMIAAALAQQSPLILLDEPTTYLDPHHCDDILQLLESIKLKHNITIISVTHDINHAAIASDKIVALKNGKVIFDGNTIDCMQPHTLQHIYDQSFTLVKHPSRNINMALPG